ncbi:MAG: pantoate--beta-alanine ligase [Muribaculaceae bacterium]|nr:pantoate--beta-alanine ligase [Muribaculaceae bacterium]
MKVIRTVAELKQKINEEKALGHSIGLVPTMGALHAGHISLIDRARTDNDIVVVSVFVNPTQFNNPDDLRTYPRTEKDDCEKLIAAGVDYAFIPSVEEIYPEPDNRVFDLGPVAEVMEGPMRPGHFNGVAQIVSKLFNMIEPNRAYFGEKDFQQIAVIRRMIELEGFNLEIIDCPIKREDDGLAMSSRNVRLTPEQRAIAPNIARTLNSSIDFSLSHSVSETKQYVIDTINAFPQMKVEYYEIVNATTMQPINDWDDTQLAVGCITVYCGEVRLIDNIKYTR